MDACPIRQIVDVRRVMNAVAAGTSNQNSSSVDCSDCDGVIFIAAFGTLTASAVTGLKAQQSSDDGSADDFTDLEGSAVATLTPTTHDNKLAVLDVFRPGKKDVRAVVTRGTANAVIDSVIAIRYRLRKAPASDHSTVASAKTLISPAEGTA